ncbi:single-stranded DNA-binding protein [Streptomyces sp. NPDC002835]
MSGEITPTVHGIVQGDPQLRHAPSGRPVARFQLASTPREYHRPTGEWRDGAPVIFLCTVWGRLAQHVAASLADGVHVVVTGHLTACDRELHMTASRVGIDLNTHVAYVDHTLPAQLTGRQPAAPPPNHRLRDTAQPPPQRHPAAVGVPRGWAARTPADVPTWTPAA